MKTANVQRQYPSRGDTGRRRYTIALASASVFFFWAALYIYMPILSVYAAYQGAAASLVGIILGSYGISQLLLRIPLGVISDRTGRRRLFVLLGFAVAAVSCLMLAWAPSPAWLLVGRTLAGVAASTWVCSTVLYASYFPTEEAVRATSLATFLSGAGQMVALPLGGRLADAVGWTAPFVAGAAIAVLGGLVFLTVGDRRVAPTPGTPLAGLGRVIKRPLLLAVAAVALVGQYIGQATTYGFVPTYATSVLHVSNTALGLVGTLTTLGYTLGALAASWLALRMRPRFVLVLGLALCAISTWAVPLCGSLLALVPVRFFAGVGFGFLYPVAMGMSITGVPAEDRASAMGVFQALYALGMFVGPAASGWLVQGWGLSTMFQVTSLLPLGAALGVLALPALLRGTQSRTEVR
ncbi:MAG: MFS transporter [Anaerolineae bacterium]